ncbi:MAG: carbohydrate ABC transporter permease [Clostridia bacterium]|jgi:putative aldouronate transport system permease protein|nr:carbohydrate ABC transporter permease [Clostridia bacterium]MBR5379838.1 carbohydrate ABC transporter permease [Clostridia bacterium]MBR5750777.1 carbohydrate ABC transporter permease [Clostridia bacterium]
MMKQNALGTLSKAGSKHRKRVEAFDVVNALVLVLLSFIIVYPFYYAVMNSFNAMLTHSPSFVINTKWTTMPYRIVFHNATMITGCINSVLRTLVGTVTALTVCSCAAYAMSKSYLRLRWLYMLIFIIPTFFGGGQIPVYLNLKSLGLTNTFWVYIVPKTFAFFWMVILMTNFKNVPTELEEAAYMDGASTLRVFFTIVLPVSLPALATIALYAAVSQWNSWYDTAYYTSGNDLITLSWILMRTVKEQQFAEMTVEIRAARENSYNPEAVKMATMVVASVPIIMIYPFLQRYFVKGLMVGSIKG